MKLQGAAPGAKLIGLSVGSVEAAIEKVASREERGRLLGALETSREGAEDKDVLDDVQGTFDTTLLDPVRAKGKREMVRVASVHALAGDRAHYLQRRKKQRYVAGRSREVESLTGLVGHALERDTTAVVEEAGGKVLGAVRHPLATSDFSSFLLQAQSSGAKVIGLANAGGDTINSIKQAAEFGITQGGQSLAGLLVFVSDVHALSLKTAQGLVVTEAALSAAEHDHGHAHNDAHAGHDMHGHHEQPSEHHGHDHAFVTGDRRGNRGRRAGGARAAA